MIIKVYISNAFPISIKIIGGLFVLNVFIAHLGKDGLGLASQFQSIVTLVYGIFNALIFNYTVKKQWGEKLANIEFIDFIVWLLKISIIAALVIIFLAQPLSYLVFLSYEYKKYIILTAIQIPLISVYIALSAKMCSDNRQVLYNLANGFAALIAFTCIWLATKYLGISAVLFSIAIFYIPAIVIQLYLSKIGYKKIYRAFVSSSYDSKSLLKFSYVAVISAFLAISTQLAVRNEISQFGGWGLVGEWQTVTKISESYLLLASVPIFTYFLPKYASLASANERLTLLIRVTLINVAIVITTGLLIHGTWNNLIAILIGNEFFHLKDVFGLQVVGDIFKIINWTLIAAALGDNKLGLVLKVEVFFAILYYTLVNLLLSKYGISGTVISYCVSHTAVLLILTLNLLRKHAK